MPPSPIPAPAVRPHRGDVVFGLGIIGLGGALLALPIGVVPLVMGSRDLKAIDAGSMDATGRRRTQVGRMLGIAGTVLAIVMAINYLVVYGGHKMSGS